MVFKNRLDAAEQLFSHLSHLQGSNGIVFAVPRGGIPMGKLIADRLGWPLRPLLIKKIGHPENPEYAIGAVTLDGPVLDRSHSNVPADYLKKEVDRLSGLLEERKRTYGFKDSDRLLQRKTVLVVDDGIATGKTLSAGVAWLRRRRPDRIVLAVPVAAPEALARLEEDCDEVICLDSPSGFFGVGQYYEDFPQVEDVEVERVLSDTRR